MTRDVPPGRPCRGEAVPGSLTTSCGVVSFDRSGSGRPLVVLHDLAQSRGSFDALAEILREEHHLLAVDLLGHGASDLRPQDLSVGAQAQAMLEVIEDLRLEDAVLIGHSLGGSVAIRMASARPELFPKIVLLSAGSYDFRFPLHWRLCRSRLVWSLLWVVGGAGVIRAALRRAGASPGTARSPVDPLDTWAGWAAVGRAYRQTTSEAAVLDLEESVASHLRCPALVVWGSENRLLPSAGARVVFREQTNVRFVEVAGAGHSVHEEEPQVVADLIREFLE